MGTSHPAIQCAKLGMVGFISGLYMEHLNIHRNDYYLYYYLSLLLWKITLIPFNIYFFDVCLENKVNNGWQQVRQLLLYVLVINFHFFSKRHMREL